MMFARDRTTDGRRRGFTLVELMIVVAILGVLAVVAIPTFINYFRKAKTTEATEALNKIKKGPESYYGVGGVVRLRVTLEDSDGLRFAPDEVPIFSGMTQGTTPDAISWTADLTFTDGFCIDAAATVGGTVFTTTPCTVHDDCTGPSWMGCGSFTGVTLVATPKPSDPAVILLETAGQPLTPIFQICTLECTDEICNLICSDPEET